MKTVSSRAISKSSIFSKYPIRWGTPILVRVQADGLVELPLFDVDDKMHNQRLAAGRINGALAGHLKRNTGIAGHELSSVSRLRLCSNRHRQ